jgi:hypothetical protein
MNWWFAHRFNRFDMMTVVLTCLVANDFGWWWFAVLLPLAGLSVLGHRYAPC